LKKEVKETKTRVHMGIFLINIVTAICLFTYGIDGLRYLVKTVPNTSYLALPLTLFVAIFLLLMMKFSNLTWKEFGLTVVNWKQAVFEGIVFPIPVMAIGVCLKWALIEWNSSYFGREIFEPFAAIQDPSQKNWPYWIGLNLLYWLIIVPIQELVARGGIQGLLEKFLTGKYHILLSILMSNLIFGTVHVFFALNVGLITFFGGLFIGWIYSRTHNLISSCIAHILLGTWAISILGVAFDF
jgi:membrane protease YdiL (CAAX protease family)